jgi:septum formation topological specificity factor MinE
MKYEEIETEFMGVIQKHIMIDNGDGSFKSFPADESNPEYIAFLAQLEAEKD